MTASPTVLSALADGVLTLTLNRPDKLNSFTEEMHLALREAVQRAHDDADVRAVLLTGAGRLWMVANRHLPYETVLGQHFAQVHEVRGDNRFKVIEATGANRGAARKGRR